MTWQGYPTPASGPAQTLKLGSTPLWRATALRRLPGPASRLPHRRSLLHHWPACPPGGPTSPSPPMRCRPPALHLPHPNRPTHRHSRQCSSRVGSARPRHPPSPVLPRPLWPVRLPCRRATRTLRRADRRRARCQRHLHGPPLVGLRHPGPSPRRTSSLRQEIRRCRGSTRTSE
jgi:hypothetical protein